jgi:hypothetical protein
MKKIVIFAILILMFNACSQNKENEVIPSKNNLQSNVIVKKGTLVDNLKQDIDFKNLNYYSQVFTNTFIKKITGIPKNNQDNYVNYLNDLSQDLSDTEKLNNFYNAMGFSSGEEGANLYTLKRQASLNLRNRYPELLELNQQSIYKVFEEAGWVIKNDDLYGFDNSVEGGPRSDCVGAANANLAFDTIACAGMAFIPVAGWFIGPACEAAACSKHYYAIKACQSLPVR